MRKPRKNYTPVEKVAILRRHLIDHVPVSDLCDEHQLSPTLFYPGRSSSSRTARGLRAQERRARGPPPADHRRAARQAPAQERSRRRIDGGTYQAKKRAWGTLTGAWVPHDTRDSIVDFVRHWSERTEIPVQTVHRLARRRRQQVPRLEDTLRLGQRAQRPGPPRLVARAVGEDGHPRLPRRPSPGGLPAARLHDARRRRRRRQPLERLPRAPRRRIDEGTQQQALTQREGLPAAAPAARALARRRLLHQRRRHVLLPLQPARRLQPVHRPLGDPREHDRSRGRDDHPAGARAVSPTRGPGSSRTTGRSSSPRTSRSSSGSAE